MKPTFLLALFLAALPARAAEPPAKVALECDGKKLVYSDFVRVPASGAPPEHFILVHDDVPEFKDVRLADGDVPFRPCVPYVSVGKTRFPLSQFGVYWLRQEGDSLVLDFLVAGLPKEEDQKSVEEFIRIMLRKPSTEKEFIEQMRASLGKE